MSIRAWTAYDSIHGDIWVSDGATALVKPYLKRKMLKQMEHKRDLKDFNLDTKMMQICKDALPGAKPITQEAHYKQSEGSKVPFFYTKTRFNCVVFTADRWRVYVNYERVMLIRHLLGDDLRVEVNHDKAMTFFLKGNTVVAVLMNLVIDARGIMEIERHCRAVA